MLKTVVPHLQGQADLPDPENEGTVLLWNVSTHLQGITHQKPLWWSRGSMLAFSTQVLRFKPDRSRRIFKSEKILSTPSFGGEVKPSVPCHRFAACKRSLNGVKSSFWQNYQTTFSPTVPTSAARISHVVADVEAPGGEKWEHLKSGGKQWQATPKNLPRMQRTRAIPFAWLNSGLCPDQPKGWIPIINNNTPEDLNRPSTPLQERKSHYLPQFT